MPGFPAVLPHSFPLIGLLLFSGIATGAETTEQDQFEERTLSRAVEKAVRVAKSDRVAWIKELESEFPNRIGNPLKDEEYLVWFDLVAEKGGMEWRKENSPSAGFKELFDRVVQRMELGPVPSIRREEFQKYAKRALVPGNPPSGKDVPDPNEDADKVFRTLDRNGDGILELEEMTTKLREVRKEADTDMNGRIDKDEYRMYFYRRVSTAVDAALAKQNEQNKNNSDTKTATRPSKPSNGLPGWFTDLDPDNEGQITLAQWRKAGKSIDLFMAMDLNGDGLLTKDEYLRYIQMKEKEEEPVKAPAKPKK
jgi:Ca2+-binding EF-hand superfamily protein